MVGGGILTPKNADKDALTDQALRRFPGQEVFLLSADSVEEQQSGAVPVEYLDTLLPSELLPHRLTLKIGAQCASCC
ncbi:hypothetical protein WJX75_001449 [Coccomyxa subellipsoidea]|uniref:ATP-dependent DNA helicase n=1 Tax=Coccomyxa subellipsoidea TaxID=248742 RepID=A0ABR2Z1U7_9CHLO